MTCLIAADEAQALQGVMRYDLMYPTAVSAEVTMVKDNTHGEWVKYDEAAAALTALSEQVAELTRERDEAQALAADAFVQLTQQQAARVAAEAKVARLRAALLKAQGAPRFDAELDAIIDAALTEGTPE